jgi:hypothetical protein
MRSLACILLVFLAAVLGCNTANPPRKRLSEAQVLAIADWPPACTGWGHFGVS